MLRSGRNLGIGGPVGASLRHPGRGVGGRGRLAPRLRLALVLRVDEVGQGRAYEVGLYIPYGQWTVPIAYRDNLQGISAENYSPLSGFITGTLWKTLSKS